MNSYHVKVAAEAYAAALFAHAGCDVSVQYGANQPRYDLLSVRGDKVIKVSVKGSQDGSWGLTQKFIKNADYQRAIDDWLAEQGRRLLFCLIQFKGVALGECPRAYLAKPIEIAQRLRATARGRGETILYEHKEWTARAHGSGTIDAIPEAWRFTEERLNSFFQDDEVAS
ncbi:MAG: hypothetical protein FD161_2375 [Limisphaerales bacterium]|nr:MAG: hypothetical protein FD161_2375 [Limisphaerales bacterium]KAG0508708.1 MAG: hypothetical protein E1N63_2126 [Limisphaerales bacterium]TXT50358.1 MAG: hypothetical protein FD140_2429 [Limisphaerales bacterium]